MDEGMILEESTALDYNPLNDVLFKFIFGREERKQITLDFLNAVLEESLKQPIRDLTFLQTEMNPGHEADKLTRLDVACVLESGEQVDVEVQVLNEHNMRSRTLFYWAQMYVMSLAAGQNYRDLKPVITINILAFNMLPQKDPHAMYGIYNLKTGDRLLKDLELHFLEIPKYADLPKKPVAEMTRMERWLAYFANKLNQQEKEELAMSDTAIYDAMQAAKLFLSSDAERHAYMNREMAIMDRKAQFEAAREDGFAKGSKVGFSKGRDAGREEAQVQNIRMLMKNTGASAEKAMGMLGVKKSLRPKYLARL